MARTLAEVRKVEPSAVRNAGIGSPHERWREMHQSGRDSSMPRRRLRPHSGVKPTSSATASSARPRSVFPSRFIGRSTPTNHCSVARKMTGVFERQSCGYECEKAWSKNRCPLARRLSVISLFASQIDLPRSHAGTVSS